MKSPRGAYGIALASLRCSASARSCAAYATTRTWLTAPPDSTFLWTRSSVGTSDQRIVGAGSACVAALLSHSSLDNRQPIALQRWLIEQDPPLANEIFLNLDSRPSPGVYADVYVTDYGNNRMVKLEAG
jgi:hypothetical protein